MTPFDIPPRTPADYLDALARVVYSADRPWAEVAPYWPEIREALHGFEPRRLAGIGLDDLARLLDDPRLRDQPDKAVAVVANAEAMQKLSEKWGSFGDYLHDHDSVETLLADLTRDLHHIQRSSAEAYLRLLTERGEPYQVDLGLTS